MRMIWLLMLSLSVAASVAARAGELVVSDARVREVIPGQSVTVAFLTATNQGTQTCILGDVSSTAAGRVAVHEHRHEGGVMRMRPVAEVSVAPGAELRLQPGGYHLMLFGVSALKSGESIPLRLDFGQCGIIELEAPVVALER